ncbi:MAG: hypothetical protein IIY21_06220 [Clostridiales bacterium]|nr:hypothetical protein [Clostridiales bacterium]
MRTAQWYWVTYTNAKDEWVLMYWDSSLEVEDSFGHIVKRDGKYIAENDRNERKTFRYLTDAKIFCEKVFEIKLTKPRTAKKSTPFGL